MKNTKRITVIMGLGIFGLAATASAAPLARPALAPASNIQVRPGPALRAGVVDGKQPRARKAKHRDRFAQLDTNRDGKLQVAEVMAHRNAKLAKKLAKMDTNRDGILQKAERKRAFSKHKARGNKARMKAKDSRRKGRRMAKRGDSDRTDKRKTKMDRRDRRQAKRGEGRRGR